MALDFAADFVGHFQTLSLASGMKVNLGSGTSAGLTHSMIFSKLARPSCNFPKRLPLLPVTMAVPAMTKFSLP